jgi:hypothetical protein
MKTRAAGLLALGLLAACGSDPQDRVTGGAAAGAATGAGVGALGGPVGALAGAGIGGAAGAVTGATTSPEQVNLGTPIWNDPEVRVPGATTTSGTRGSATRTRGNAQTRDLQQALARQGYDVGPADGVYGPRTRQAVMDWQMRNNMPATGRPDSRMMSSLGVTGGATGTRGTASDRDRAYMGGGAVGGSSATGAGTVPGGTMGGGAGGIMPGTVQNRDSGATGPGGPSGADTGSGQSGGTPQR